MEIRNPALLFNMRTRGIEGSTIVCYKKYYKDMKSYYGVMDENISDDTVMYDVESTDREGDNPMFIGITTLYPVTVNEECNMTRGHYHIVDTEPEIYFGITGKGLLLYMDKEGDSFAENIYPGSIHYIDGKYAHRLVNTSDEALKVGACWNKLAGHDYKSIEEKPFPKRVFKINNEIVLK